MLSSLRNKTQYLVKGGLVALTVSACTLVGGSTAFAQSTTSEDFTNEGSSGSTFQKIWVGARSAGMGGAYSALADDITALYWNPAGIAKLHMSLSKPPRRRCRPFDKLRANGARGGRACLPHARSG